MSRLKESDFAEVVFDHIFLESFPTEKSAYYKDITDIERDKQFDQFRSKLIWHINHSLSKRQKEVMKLIMAVKRQSQIGQILGIKQQVVFIYKKRAINRLKKILGL
ncbi:MAG: LuxR C-terminal-related transcriptional regulator [Candidatus Zixiibacteriota bacterium]